MQAWHDWDDPLYDDARDDMCWEPATGRENDETRGWRTVAVSDGPRRTVRAWRRLEVEAAGGVFECDACPAEFALPYATLCVRCGRSRAEWDALQEAA